MSALTLEGRDLLAVLVAVQQAGAGFSSGELASLARVERELLRAWTTSQPVRIEVPA